MPASASTTRLRWTLALYLALVPATLFLGPRSLPPQAHSLLGATGFLCVALAVLGRLWCSLFIAGRKDAELVTSGPYSLCRHPLYALSVLGALGLALASRSLLPGVAAVWLVSMLVIRAMAIEELQLAQAFPAQFRAYLAATPNRLLPRWQTTAVPSQLQVNPQLLWKAFLDAGSFLLLWMLVEAAARWRMGFF